MGLAVQESGVRSLELIDPRRHADVWRQFVGEQRRCYERFDVAAATVDVDATRGDVWCVVALRGDVLVAGARVQLRTPSRPLALEGLLGGHPVLRAEIEARRADGVAEVSGLWATEDLAGTGIGGPVIAAAVACAAAIPVRHLVSFAHHLNRFTRAVGFEPAPRLGVHPYPNDRYRSTVNWCDAFEPSTASRARRSRSSLRTSRPTAATTATGRPRSRGLRSTSGPRATWCGSWARSARRWRA